ncbi:MAG: hypothetical protein ACRDT7_09510 [Microbacterium sp.]
MTSRARAATQKNRSPVRRGFAAEFRRMRGASLPWVFLPLALLSALSLVLSSPPGLRAAPGTVIETFGAELSASAFSGLIVISAVLGALGVTLADRTGVLAREQVFGASAVVFGARAVSTVLTSLVSGAVGILIVEVAFRAISGAQLLTLPDAVRTAVALAGAGLWGFLIGVLVRSPILVLFVVPATLMPALLLADIAPAVADVLPMQALLSSAGLSDGGLWGGGAAAVMTSWVLVLALVAAFVVRRRDRL